MIVLPVRISDLQAIGQTVFFRHSGRYQLETILAFDSQIEHTQTIICISQVNRDFSTNTNFDLIGDGDDNTLVINHKGTIFRDNIVVVRHISSFVVRDGYIRRGKGIAPWVAIINILVIVDDYRPTKGVSRYQRFSGKQFTFNISLT